MRYQRYLFKNATACKFCNESEKIYLIKDLDPDDKQDDAYIDFFVICENCLATGTKISLNASYLVRNNLPFYDRDYYIYRGDILDDEMLEGYKKMVRIDRECKDAAMESWNNGNFDIEAFNEKIKTDYYNQEEDEDKENDEE